jgi:parvulin-like peptidyl-prolyl isomerase
MNKGIIRVLFMAVVFAGNAAAAEQSAREAIGQANEPLPATVFATVGEETITLEQYQVNLHASVQQRFFHGSVPKEKLAALRSEVARQLIDRVLLRQEAKRRGITADDAWIRQREDEIVQRYRSSPQWQENKEKLLTTLREQLTEDSKLNRLESAIKQVPEPGDEEVMQYYKTHQGKFTTPERIRVSIILLKVEPWSPDTAWQAAHDEAIRLVKQLRSGEGPDFAELARLHSGDESAARGGDLGYLHKGMLTDEAQHVLDRMNVGDISEPVQMLKGIAIFRLDERVKPVLNTFADSKTRAHGLLMREKKELAWEKFLEGLRAGTRIRMNESIL